LTLSRMHQQAKCDAIRHKLCGGRLEQGPRAQGAPSLSTRRVGRVPVPLVRLFLLATACDSFTSAPQPPLTPLTHTHPSNHVLRVYRPWLRWTAWTRDGRHPPPRAPRHRTVAPQNNVADVVAEARQQRRPEGVGDKRYIIFPCLFGASSHSSEITKQVQRSGQ
jgi:hypothetical protein